MYSTYWQDDIQELDKDALIKIRDELDTMGLIQEDGEIGFSYWSGHKLEGYWYKETRKILKAIAPHIKGFVEFSYEEGYPFRLIFENGKVIFKRGSFDWSEIDGEEL